MTVALLNLIESGLSKRKCMAYVLHGSSIRSLEKGSRLFGRKGCSSCSESTKKQLFLHLKPKPCGMKTPQ